VGAAQAASRQIRSKSGRKVFIALGR